MSNKRLHVERVKPEFSISESGLVSWKSSLTDYDASLFYRGKTVSNDEFNALFLNKTYQGNYLADSLTEFFKTHLPEVISRRFRSQFDLHKSFVKVFDSTLWGNKQEDGYYYITIPATEHGITPPSDQPPVEGMNVDTEMYLLDATTGTFYEVSQVETDVNNTVQIYTDDNTLSGFVVIRSNDKSFVLAEGRIDVSQIDGLAPVAISGNYEELKFRPDDIIAANTNAIASIISDTAYDDEHPFVHKADYATQAEEAEYAQNLLSTGTIQNIPISEIFEEASRTVKKATTAKDYDVTGNIASAFIRVEDKAREVDRRVEGLLLGEETVKNAENLLGTIAADAVAVTQALTDASNRVATTAFVTDKIVQQLEEKMNRWEIIYNAPDNTERYVGISADVMQQYGLFKIILVRHTADGSLDVGTMDAGEYTYAALKKGVSVSGIFNTSRMNIKYDDQNGSFIASSSDCVLACVLGMKL